MSNITKELLITSYEKLQSAISKADSVINDLNSVISNGNLQNYITISQLEEKMNKSEDEILAINKNLNDSINQLSTLDKLKAQFIYGMKADANYYKNGKWYSDPEFCYESTDNTKMLQNYIDDVITVGGGTIYIPKGRYLINGTIYINPDITMPIDFCGELTCRNVPPLFFDNNKQTNNRNFGTVFICNAKEVFYINTDSEGNQNLKGSLPSANFDAFKVRNIAFMSNKDSSGDYIGSTAFTLHGVRMKAYNIAQRGMSKLFSFPEADASGWKNYSDFIEIDGIYSKEIQYGLIELCRADTCKVKNIHSESPSVNSRFLIKIVETHGFRVENVSSSIHKESSVGIGIFVIVNCRGGIIEDVLTTNQFQYASSFDISSSTNIRIDTYMHNALSSTSITNPLLTMSDSDVEMNQIHNWVANNKSTDIIIKGSENYSKLSLHNINCRIRSDSSFKNSKRRLLTFDGCLYLRANGLIYEDMKEIDILSKQNEDNTWGYDIKVNGEVVETYGVAKWESGLLIPNSSPFVKMSCLHSQMKVDGYTISYLAIPTSFGTNYKKLSFYDFSGNRIATQDAKCSVKMICN